MKIEFDRSTKLRKIQPMLLVFPELIQEAKKHVTETISVNVFDFFGMTITEFLRLQENVLPEKIEKILKKRKTTFFDYIKIVNTFEIGTKNFHAIIESTNPPRTAEEDAATSGLLEMSTEESMLSFLCEHFNLQSFEQAQNLTLYEYISARKISFNNVKYQKNLANIQKFRK